VFDAAPVVPAAVEDHDLAGGRKLLQITLDEHLRLLPIRRRRQRHGAKDARAHALGEGLDSPALAGRIAPFEHDDDPGAALLDPVLQVAEFDLELAQLLLIGLALHPALAVRFFCLHGHAIARSLASGRFFDKTSKSESCRKAWRPMLWFS